MKIACQLAPSRRARCSLVRLWSRNRPVRWPTPRESRSNSGNTVAASLLAVGLCIPWTGADDQERPDFPPGKGGLSGFAWHAESPTCHSLSNLCFRGPSVELLQKNEKSPRFRGAFGWAQVGSNHRPPACEAGALPLSYAPRSGFENSRRESRRRFERRLTERRRRSRGSMGSVRGWSAPASRGSRLPCSG
jgi:hypothetical protein